MTEIEEQVWASLESIGVARKDSFNQKSVNASKHEITLQKRKLMEFLDNIDGSFSVMEVREALDNYEG